MPQTGDARSPSIAAARRLDCAEAFAAARMQGLADRRASGTRALATLRTEMTHFTYGNG